jgi:hypothetical protein
LSIKNLIPAHENVVHGLNLIGKYFSLPTFKLEDFTSEGFDGYVFHQNTPRETSLYIDTDNKIPTGTLDIRHWGHWETDPQCDWDQEDDDWQVLSSGGVETINSIAKEVAIELVNINPNLKMRWQTSEKNHIELTVYLSK